MIQAVDVDTPGKLRRALGDELFRARPAVYWMDFGVSMSVGWAAYLLALPRYSPGRPAQALWIAIAALAFYRALFFVHEIVHFRKEKFRAFRFVWNALCGSMFFLPEFTYQIHGSHHSISTFSTNNDPEYVPLAYQKPVQLLAPFLIFPLAPILMMVRFLILAPLSWIIGGRFRAWLLRYASSLKMNPQFEWKDITDEDRRMAVWQEIGCLVWWTAFLGAGLPAAGFRILVQWYVVFYLILTVNHVRAMVAHRYINGAGERVGYDDQLLDSVTITGSSPAALLLAPVGLRYHSLHHMFPSLPYHALGKAHQRLLEVLPPDHTYCKTLVPGVSTAFREFFRTVWLHQNRAESACLRARL